ncbi:unnamed protein product [marine sediment metagenome]|uniref:Methyltransferase type 11 domain-containing protein n=1 Tax=marine sediment metagenome TaxID=412755 RepID=X1IUH5_9ZZZZ
MPAKKLSRLNIACCTDYRPGWLNIDKSHDFKADKYFDLELPWPLSNDSAGEMIAYHIVEHIKDLRHFMRQAHRVLAKDATLHIKAPWWSGHWAVGDPTHVRLINDMTFNPWCCWFDRYPHVNDACRFDQVWEKFNSDPGWGRDPFLKKGGFSEIEEYELLLRKV